MKFGVRKLESWGWWRNHDASFPHFDTIPACDRPTDWRRTDRQTDTLLSQRPTL